MHVQIVVRDIDSAPAPGIPKLGFLAFLDFSPPSRFPIHRTHLRLCAVDLRIIPLVVMTLMHLLECHRLRWALLHHPCPNLVSFIQFVQTFYWNVPQ